MSLFAELDAMLANVAFYVQTAVVRMNVACYRAYITSRHIDTLFRHSLITYLPRFDVKRCVFCCF